MADFQIPRDDVHSLSEACANSRRFPVIAGRLLKQQRQLTRFVKKNAPVIEGVESQVAIYLYSVIVRIFDVYDNSKGKLSRVSQENVGLAAARVRNVAADVLPFDDGFAERVRAVEWRAQPHILDEALWALFERDEIEEGEVDVDPEKAGLIFLVLWAATEALNDVWVYEPPAED